VGEAAAVELTADMLRLITSLAKDSHADADGWGALQKVRPTLHARQILWWRLLHGRDGCAW
jgi:hypothetical protein